MREQASFVLRTCARITRARPFASSSGLMATRARRRPCPQASGVCCSPGHPYLDMASGSRNPPSGVEGFQVHQVLAFLT